MLQDEEIEPCSAETLNGMTVREAALTLAARLHLPLLPVCSADHHGMSMKHMETCRSPGKAPLISDWRHKATFSTETIQEWFRSWPDCNIGLTLGSKSGIIAIDVDGEYGHQKLQEIFGHSLPDTWQFSTPGGGMRYLFRSPTGIELRKSSKAGPMGGHEELAFLGDGQMTVLPPSRHHNGGKYEWLSGKGPADLPIADAPDVMIRYMSAARAAQTAPANDVGPGESTKRETVISTLSNPVLQKLSKKCLKAEEHIKRQTQDGCDEQTWFWMVSMLVRAGVPDTALAFSSLSLKHNVRSEQRIRKIEEEGENATYGPTRCATFGCDEAQIQRCHSSVRKDPTTGEINNSPATFLGSSRAKTASALTVLIEEKASLLSNRYAVKETNLCLVQRDNEGNTRNQPLANFFAWITKDIEREDGAERRRFYEIRGLILRGQKMLPPIVVPANEFDGMKWLALWGPEPNIQPGTKMRDTVRHAIQSTASAAMREQRFSHLGWVRIHDRWAYLHAGGAVGATGHVEVELDPRLKNYLLPASTGDPAEAMRVSLRLLDVAPLRVTLVLWALVFLSPLCEWLRRVHLEPKFLVWLYGYTGTRKTTLSKLFLCHFGDLLEHPPASFKDTANSLERRSSDAKDSLLLVDDYHPARSQHEEKAMAQIAEQLLRGFGDRIGRGRMTKDIEQRGDYPPRGMALVTAEDILSGGSSVARLFTVELLQGDADLAKLTEAQSHSAKLAEAMVGYLQWLGQAMDEREDRRLTDVFCERRNTASRPNAHGRLAEAAAWLYLGLDVGLEYAVSVGAIGTERREQLLEEAWNHFQETASVQGEQVAEVRATERFLSVVAQLLANGTIYTRRENAADNSEPPRSGTHVGWHNNQCYYFLPEVLYNAVCRFLSAQGSHFPVSSRMLWKQLADEGITQTETDRNRRYNTVKKTLEGERSRKLAVKIEFLREAESGQTQPRVRPAPRGPGPRPDPFALESEGSDH